MDELNPTVREQEIYEEMELTGAWTPAPSARCGAATIM